MQRSLIKFSALAFVLTTALAGHATEESTWGQIKSQLEQQEDPAAKRVYIQAKRTRNGLTKRTAIRYGRVQPRKFYDINPCNDVGEEDAIRYFSGNPTEVSASSKNTGYQNDPCSKFVVDIVVTTGAKFRLFALPDDGPTPSNANKVLRQSIEVYKKTTPGNFVYVGNKLLKHEWVPQPNFTKWNSTITGGNTNLFEFSGAGIYRIVTRTWSEQTGNDYPTRAGAALTFWP